MSNSNENQELERRSHFKNVFATKDVSSATAAADNGLNTTNVDVSESRRPSVVMPPATLQTTRLHSVEEEDASGDTEIESDALLSPSSTVIPPHASPTDSSTATLAHKRRAEAMLLQNKRVCKPGKVVKRPLRKFRSRSLPNIFNASQRRPDFLLSHIPTKHSHETSSAAMDVSSSIEDVHNTNKATDAKKLSCSRRHHHHHHHHHLHQATAQASGQAFLTTPPSILLPPVNLQSMQEIDLHEVLKNSQLRHDILFDPQVQFRPNLDGERGRRKKLQADNYWAFIRREIGAVLRGERTIGLNSPIGVMFDALKGILLSLIPSKDKPSFEKVLDMNLLIQQLNTASFDFAGFADWISSVFKLHCAPMRDEWVDSMNAIFHEACDPDTGAIDADKLVSGLRVLFSILEAMKLDVANHQIRILRPLLCSTAVAFEKEYFACALKKRKINFTLSLLWFKKHSNAMGSKDVRKVLDAGVLSLLSCSHMVAEFPNTLAFDHSRLVMLRADVRHLICTKLCAVLYRTMVKQNGLPAELCSPDHLFALKKQILNIIVDETGNSKWTRNLHSLAVHIVNVLFGTLDQSKVDFCFNWLLKQTQPSSKVYTLLEQQLFAKIRQGLSDSQSIEDDYVINDELCNVTERLKKLIDLNCNVFGSIYASYLD